MSNAKGLAILTVLKAGFLFSGRAGSGIIVARLPDGSWSAPSAIMTAGAGVGGQIGAELTDFVFILNNKAAVDSFAQVGSITLGGNVSLAAGPVGRNAEAAGSASLKSVAAVFSYSKTKGLFAGVSLEGSVLVERRDANRNFYGQNCKASSILSGRVEPPPSCDPLFRVLESRAFQGRNYWENDQYDDFYDDIPEFSDRDSVSSTSRRGSFRRDPPRGRASRFEDDDGYYDEDEDDHHRRGGGGGGGYSRRNDGGGGASWEDDLYDRPQRNQDRSQFRSTYSDNPGRPSQPKPEYNRQRSDSGGYRGGRSSRFDYDAPRRYDGERRREHEREVTVRRHENQEKGEKAVALYTFDGEQSGDLSFRKGDIITIVEKSKSTDDWWTGKIGGHEGIFPANYVELA